jgi:hypothetical protein
VSKKRPIPALPATSAELGRVAFDVALKENIEIITGARSGPIQPLTDTSTTSDIIKKINELLARLQ